MIRFARQLRPVLAVLSVVFGVVGIGVAAEPIKLHPENPRYFLFRGKPMALVTATEHYGAVINRELDFEKYLADHAARGLNLTRTFMLFRELQTPVNPHSTCKPETADFVAPYPLAYSGELNLKNLKYDLDKWNPEYFARLKKFLTLASQHGIIVEVTIFSNTYADDVWGMNPLNPDRNNSKFGKITWPEYTTLRHKDLVARQTAFAKKIVQETAGFDNVYYEICNEPAGGYAHAAKVTTEEVDKWLEHMAGVVRDELKSLKSTHLVVGAESLSAAKPNIKQEFAKSYSGKTWDAIILHASDFDVWNGRMYKLGGFMNKDLKLAEKRDFFLAVSDQKKPMISDEDNVASAYTTPSGWTVSRKRAWTTLLSGGHYDVIDFSVQIFRPTGMTPGIRTPLGHLARFMQTIDFIHAKPGAKWITGLPKHVVASGMAAPKGDYVVYLADAREVNEADAGSEIKTSVTLEVPAASYSVSVFSPVTGLTSQSVPIQSNGQLKVQVPPFKDDIVVRARRAN